MARRIEVQLLGDSASLERAFSRSSTAARGFNLSIGSLAKSAAVIGALSAAYEGLKSAVDAGIGEFVESSKINAQTAAALKSTGDVAGVTAKQITDLGLS